MTILSGDIVHDFTQMIHLSWAILILAAKSDLWTSTFTSCESLLKIKNVNPTPDIQRKNLHFNKLYRLIMWAFKFQKHWFIYFWMARDIERRTCQVYTKIMKANRNRGLIKYLQRIYVCHLTVMGKKHHNHLLWPSDSAKWLIMLSHFVLSTIPWASCIISQMRKPTLTRVK